MVSAVFPMPEIWPTTCTCTVVIAASIIEMSLLPKEAMTVSDGRSSIPDVLTAKFNDVMNSVSGKPSESKPTRIVNARVPPSSNAAEHIVTSPAKLPVDLIAPVTLTFIPVSLELKVSSQLVDTRKESTGLNNYTVPQIEQLHIAPTGVRNAGVAKEVTDLNELSRPLASSFEVEKDKNTMCAKKKGNSLESTPQPQPPDIDAKVEVQVSSRPFTTSAGTDESALKEAVKSIMGNGTKAPDSSPVRSPAVQQQKLPITSLGNSSVTASIEVTVSNGDAVDESKLTNPIGSPFVNQLSDTSSLSVPTTLQTVAASGKGLPPGDVINAAPRQHVPGPDTNTDGDAKHQSDMPSPNLVGSVEAVQDQRNMVPQIAATGHVSPQGQYGDLTEVVPSAAGERPTLPTASKHALTEGIRSDSSVASPASLPAIYTAKVVQSMGQTEMKVGINSVEFGNISIRTSSSREAMVTQIVLDHDGLARELATHIPEIQLKMGSSVPAVVRIDVTGAFAANGSDGSRGMSNDASSHSDANKQQGSRATANYLGSTITKANLHQVAAAPMSLSSMSNSRLDIRV